MRAVLAVLVVTCGVAYGAPSLSQLGPSGTLEDPIDLATSCELDVRLHGAIAEVELRERIVNHNPDLLGAVQELELARGAQLIGLSAGGVAATPVATGFAVQPAEPAAVGADPAIAQALQPSERGRPRYRIVVEPIRTGGELALVLRWTAIADIHGGALHLELPALAADDTRPACRGTVRAEPGPGVAISRIAIDGAETRTFALGTADVAIAVQLAFARPEPAVWRQVEPLGDGWLARAITVIAPPNPSRGAGRALFVIDGSRSMELVGRVHVEELVRAIAAALPPATRLDAIVFDRAATRVLGDWRPNTPDTAEAIASAIEHHAAGNGSDAAAAAALARQVIGASEPATIITITDGVFGELPSQALVTALDAKPAAIDVHAIVLEPGRMHAPVADVLRAPAVLYGGTFVELPVDQLDRAMISVASWLQPAWLELSLGGARAATDQLLAGDGTVALQVTHVARPIVLTAHNDHAVKLAAGPGPGAPIAQLALAPVGSFDLAGLDDQTGDRAEQTRARLTRGHPAADGEHALAVLSTTGRVARDRRAMIAGGGPYIRVVSAIDPAFPPEVLLGHAQMFGGSAIDRDVLDRLFKLQLQPKAYACYERALVRNPRLAGTVTFHFEIGRGEVTRATVDSSGDPAFDGCLIDAGYGLSPPLPNPDFNIDDRTIANYPLTFSVHAEHAQIVAGDADSSEPLDIDNIPAGAPRPVQVDARTPLGNLRPSPAPH